MDFKDHCRSSIRQHIRMSAWHEARALNNMVVARPDNLFKKLFDADIMQGDENLKALIGVLFFKERIDGLNSK